LQVSQGPIADDAQVCAE